MGQVTLVRSEWEMGCSGGGWEVASDGGAWMESERSPANYGPMRQVCFTTHLASPIGVFIFVARITCFSVQRHLINLRVLTYTR